MAHSHALWLHSTSGTDGPALAPRDPCAHSPLLIRAAQMPVPCENTVFRAEEDLRLFTRMQLPPAAPPPRERRAGS